MRVHRMEEMARPVVDFRRRESRGKRAEVKAMAAGTPARSSAPAADCPDGGTQGECEQGECENRKAAPKAFRPD